MTGYIRLGAPGALRDYQIQSIQQYQASLANPFAAQINTQSVYGELASFSEWVLDDWTAGLGKRDPNAGGTLHGNVDTRFPNQMILPFGWQYPYTNENPALPMTYAPGTTTVDGTIITAASVSFTNGASAENPSNLWVYVDADTGTTISAAIYSDNGEGQPNTLVAACAMSGSITKYRPGPLWVRMAIDGTQIDASTRYHIVLTADGPFSFPHFGMDGELTSTFDGTSWTWATSGFAYVMSYITATATLGLQAGDSLLLQNAEDAIELSLHGNNRFGWIGACEGQILGAYNNQVVRLLDDTFASITSTATEVTDFLCAGGTAYIAYGTGYKTYVAKTGTVTDVSDTAATLFAVDGQYLYRATGNRIYYTANGTDWTTVDDPVGYEGFDIQGMAALGGYLYLATDAGLYRLAPGDFVEPVMRWPSVSQTNGRGMLEWNNSLYIPLREDIIRFALDGSVTQIGLRTGEELPVDLQGRVYRLHATPYFLLASTERADNDQYSGLWAYNGQGWHQLGTLPQDVKGSALYVDTAAGHIYWTGSYGLVARGVYPTNVVNPIRDRGAKRFERYGWVEHDRFYGGHVALDKDWESIYINAEDMTSSTIYMYWKDSESTDWELLGSTTATEHEERWDDYSSRPNSKWLRLGLLLRTDDEEYSPILRAHRVKFHTMIADRWRWSVAIPVHDQQEMLDGSLNPYTAAQMKTHLESMIQRVPPLIFEDVDGTQYEVKVMQAARNIVRAEHFNAEAQIQYVYNLVLEQVTDAAYSS